MLPPSVGDLRVCHVPLIAEHATSVDVPDLAVAGKVYEALAGTLAVLVEHGQLIDAGEVIVQRFEEDGWRDIDPTDTVAFPPSSAQDRLAAVDALLSKPFPKNDFYVNGMPTTYHALAEFYGEKLAVELARIMRPEMVDDTGTRGRLK